jgi:conjugal transfer pilus assembly protein TraF
MTDKTLFLFSSIFYSYVLLLLVVVFLTIGLPTSKALASEDLCKKQNLGWHFYCDPKKQNKNDKSKKETSSLDPVGAIKEIQEELEYKKALAIISPTKENIASYIEYQQKQIEKASYFSDQWSRVIWTNPSLDYTLKHPVSNLGNQVQKDERTTKVNQTVQNINERYGIFFFFRSDCPYCHKYGPILKHFAKNHNLFVMPISLDGGKLEGWEEAVTDSGQASSFGIEGQGVPATILFDKETKEILPIGFGLMSQDEIANRIYVLTKVEVGNDY